MDKGPEEWLFQLNQYLKLEAGPKKKQTLKLFFHRVISLDSNKYQNDDNYCRLLAYHACFLSANSKEIARSAFKNAAIICKTMPFIHIAFAQFEIMFEDRRRANEALEYGLRYVADKKEIRTAIELININKTDIGLLNDDLFLLCKEISSTSLKHLNGNSKMSPTNQTSENYTKVTDTNLLIRDELDQHMSSQTIEVHNKALFETPRPLDTSKMRLSRDIINCLSMKTPSPPKFVLSPKKKDNSKNAPLNSSVILPTPKNKINPIKLSASAKPSKVQSSTSKQGPVRVPIELLQRLSSSEEKENDLQNAEDNLTGIIPLEKEIIVDKIGIKPLESKDTNKLSTNISKKTNNILPCKQTDIIKQQWIESSKDFVINNKVYIVISQLGMGGSSKVYKVFDVIEKAIRAVKQVSLQDYDETIRLEFQNEIAILQKLKNNANIIHLYDYELTQDFLYIIMECGSADLSHLIKRREKRPKELQPYDIKHYFRKMLEAVKVVHMHGVVHLDLKPANFLLVEGHLKLIDFGIANVMQSKATSIIKETQFGTMNYMAPESLMDGGYQDNAPTFKISLRSDVWSLGCILYLMMYGNTPFQHITHQYRKMTAITNPKHCIPYAEFSDDLLVKIVKNCLIYDPKKRPTVEQLLQCF